MAKIYGELEKAQLENVTANPSLGTTGRAAFNTTTGKAVLDDGTSVKNMVTEDGAATLENKTIAAGSNTITGLTHGSEVDNPTTAHGTSSAIVGISDSQVITNKDIDGGTMTNTNRLAVPKQYNRYQKRIGEHCNEERFHLNIRTTSYKAFGYSQSNENFSGCTDRHYCYSAI